MAYLTPTLPRFVKTLAEIVPIRFDALPFMGGKETAVSAKSQYVGSDATIIIMATAVHDGHFVDVSIGGGLEDVEAQFNVELVTSTGQSHSFSFLVVPSSVVVDDDFPIYDWIYKYADVQRAFNHAHVQADIQDNLTKETPVINFTIADSVAVEWSGAVLTNGAALAGVELTLPTAQTNLTYTFTVLAAQVLTITPDTDDTIRIGPDAAAAGLSITSNTVGNSVTFVAMDVDQVAGFQWVATSVIGTWTFPGA